MAELSDLISLLTVIISGKREQGCSIEAVRPTDRPRPTMVHDLNCHLDFIKDKSERVGGGGGRTRKRGNERRAGRPAGRTHASSSSSSSNMRINGRVAENVHEYNRWPDGEREGVSCPTAIRKGSTCTTYYTMQWSPSAIHEGHARVA